MRFRLFAFLLGFSVASGSAVAGIIPAPDSVLTAAPPTPAPGATPAASATPAPAAIVPRSEEVHFARGTTSGKRVDKITGTEKINYLLGAITGQVMKVKLTSDNPNARFNILKPEATATDTPLFDGAKGGVDFSGALPRDGEYIIQVYLTSEAAAKNEVSNFTLDTGIDPLGAKTNAAAQSGPTPVPATASATDTATKAVSDTTAAIKTTATDAANSASKVASDAATSANNSVNTALNHNTLSPPP